MDSIDWTQLCTVGKSQNSKDAKHKIILKVEAIQAQRPVPVLSVTNVLYSKFPTVCRMFTVLPYILNNWHRLTEATDLQHIGDWTREACHVSSPKPFQHVGLKEVDHKLISHKILHVVRRLFSLLFHHVPMSDWNCKFQIYSDSFLYLEVSFTLTLWLVPTLLPDLRKRPPQLLSTDVPGLKKKDDL